MNPIDDHLSVFRQATIRRSLVAAYMDVPSSKAAGFITVVAILRESLDPATLTRFVAALPPETAALFDVLPIAIAWLPIEHFYAVIDTAHRVLFAGSDEGVIDLGYRSIGRDMSTIYRVLIGLASPEFVMSRTAQLWGAYNRAHGTVTVVMRGTTVAEVAYRGIPLRAPPAFWAFQRGALRPVIEATGLRNVTAKVVSPSAGGIVTIRVSGTRG